MIKSFVVRLLKLMSPPRSLPETAETDSADADFFDYKDPRLSWPARDAAVPREESKMNESAVFSAAPPIPSMRSADDITRLIAPTSARPSCTDRTIVLQDASRSRRPLADATQIITPRLRP